MQLDEWNITLHGKVGNILICQGRMMDAGRGDDEGALPDRKGRLSSPNPGRNPAGVLQG